MIYPLTLLQRVYFVLALIAATALLAAVLRLVYTWPVAIVLAGGVAALVWVGPAAYDALDERRTARRRARAARAHRRIATAIRDLPAKPPPSGWQDRVLARIDADEGVTAPQPPSPIGGRS